MTKYSVKAVSHGPKHHLFGFHDLVQTNAKGDLALALEVDDISHPPLPGETCWSGVLKLQTSNSKPQTSNFIPIHKTHTWNYPQGARQQWLGDSDLVLCNDRDENGKLVCRISDARAEKVVDTLPFPVHCVEARTRKTFGINYDRIHACGGYGYTPCEKLEFRVGVGERIANIPTDDGIFIGDLNTKEYRLLVSLAQIAACGERKAVKTGYPHYVTHPVLNPDGTRLAFLHRYRVADGGETTRLMTVGADGTNLRCLAKGFLSHFTWIANDELFIWGQDQRALCALREKPILRIPGVIQAALLAKRLIRLARGQHDVRDLGARKGETKGKAQDKFFLRIRDVDNPMLVKTAGGILTGDGHPMANPRNLHLLVNDTYWDANGDRELMFYDLDTNMRTELGKYRMIFDVPDENRFDWRSAQRGLDPRVLKKFKRDDYLFYRSGFHTDLHPRWSYDGKTAFFDSIHEGTRQIYSVEAV